MALMAQAADLPFMEDFESATTIPATFTLVNGDGNTPASAPASLQDSAFIVRYRTEFESHVAYGVSYYDPDAGADDWLILPKLALTSNPVLSWKALSLTSSGNYPDTYQVLVSTTDADTSSFTSIFEVEEEVSLEAGGPGVQKRMISLSAEGYADQEVFIAFRLMTPSPGGDRLAIDDIKVEDMLLEGFENGIPDSWTVIDGGDNPGSWFQDDYTSYAGNYCAGLDTYDASSSETDDWLITPMVTVTEGHVLSFWGRSSSTSYTEDLHVMASKTGVTAPEFTITIADISPVSPGEFGKYSFVLSDNPDLNPGDQVYIGFWCDSEGSFLNIDEVRYGELVPPKMMRAIAVSETAVDVVFDSELERMYSPGEFTLSGSADIMFSDAQVDEEDKTILHLTGASPEMAGDITLDALAMIDQEDPVEFYAGIMPLMYTSLTNPGGTMEEDINATFKAIVMGINIDTSRIWFADAAGAHNGINTYNLVTDGLELGDEVLFYGKLSPYQNQTEIYPGTQLSVVSSGNDLYAPTVITGADISANNDEDADPAEQYEGVLVTIEDVTVELWDGSYFNCTDDDGTTVFYVGDYDDLFDSDFGETTLTVDNTYDLTGLVVGRNAEVRLVPRSADDIMDVTSVEAIPGDNLKIYPVPVSDLLHIESERSLNQVEISGISGQVMRTESLNGVTSTTMDLSHFEKGVYFLRMNMDDGSILVRKVIKE
jgi:hypothetical protein